MPDEITPELFAHLLQLAALELDLEEGEYLRKEMNNQLRSIRELGAIEIDSGLPLEPHGIPYPEANSPKIRMDNPLAYPSPEKLLSQAPETEDGYIIVPEIPHKDLG
jgi:aspartyl-tRNA(Asn)/glutamyl-tRNA(Gln) amidotransferase subunit C